MEITPSGVTVEIKACELYLKLLKHGRYWKTYPHVAEEYVEDIPRDNGPDLEMEKSINKMMEILATSLSDSEKKIYLPIAEYLKTNETIKNSDLIQITGKGTSSAKRYLKRLVDLKVLDPVGNRRGRFYKRRKG